MEKVKLVYILGGGRSGSTVLGILLGNKEGVFYPGELFAWNRYKGVPSTTKEETREFWEKVMERSGGLKKYFKYDFYELIESYFSFRHIFRWWRDAKLFKDYWDSNAGLFYLLEKISGAHTLVDSSHYALRAFWLSRDPRVDVRLIYLVREPFCVVDAFLKKDIEQRYKHPLTANIYYFLVNFCSYVFYLYFPGDKKMLVRYEDLVEKPEETLSKISCHMDIKGEVQDFSDLKVGFLFEANRIKNREKIELRREKEGVHLNFFWSFMTKLIQVPFYWLFGYRLIE